MSTLSKILEHKIVAIIRGLDPRDMLKVAGALYDGGIRILEITMNSEQPIAAIDEVARAFGDQLVIGAGTVLDPETAGAAVSAGAKFILSPVVALDVIHAAKYLGVVSIPGAYTPSEIYTAYTSGADIIKVFPATSPSYIKDIKGPLPQIPLLPTGGITVENIKDFKQAGAVGFGIGSSLINTKREITEAYLAEITNNARAFVDAITDPK